MRAVRIFVGVTDADWYQQLSGQPHLEEVNFWRPSPRVAFRALAPGELFLFKLHAPLNAIVGGGFFIRYERLPLWLAWDVFGPANGAASLQQMETRVRRYTRTAQAPPQIGCIILGEPFFFPHGQWLPAPRSFAMNIVQGKGYALSDLEGMALWRAVAERFETDSPKTPAQIMTVEGARYGQPQVIRPRLGQGAFRLVTTEAYQGRCAVTGEHTLPVLEAAHIRPYSAGGPHAVENGVLLRSDLHRLFDRGYLTFDADDRRLVVSRRLREEFNNGRIYYALEGQRLSAPDPPFGPPLSEYLQWHADHVFRP